ncbi:MAG TPA: ABC transporter permease [Chlamydiales bacterium]|nr:ABC transporter permease [Chlamydiales bacterium]
MHLKYWIKKILFLFFSLWVIATLTFFLMHAIPGDPFIGEQVIPEEVLRSLYSFYGLDQPLWKQYINYLKEILHGNLGVSITYSGRTVQNLIYDAFPVSAQVGLQALFLSIPCGLLLGAISALKKGRWQDSGAMFVTTLGISVPNFVAAAIFQYLFAVYFPLFPIARWGNFEHTVLPTLTLSLLPTAYIARLTRSNLVEILQQDYIKTALAKGIPLSRVILRHALPNALLPLISYLGPVTAQILTGSFMVERIFALPGLGQWMIHSIHARDYPTIMGLTFFYSALLLTATFTVDLLLGVFDPRVHQKEKVFG